MSNRFSAPITLLSGLPGHGKTLMAVTYAVEARKEGQRVFQVGIRDCNPQVAELWCPSGCDATLMADFSAANQEPATKARLDAVMRWREIPPGGILIVDECQDYFPVRQPGQPPEWILMLARLRQFGMQLWLITQEPRNIDSFVRRLIGAHVHIERKMGTRSAVTFRWEKVAEDVQDYHARKASAKSAFRQTKKNFQYYTSATQHLVKRKLPWQVLLGVPVVIGCAVACYFAFRMFTGHGVFQSPEAKAAAVTTPGQIKQSTPGGPSGQVSDRSRFEGLNAEQYAAVFRPRLPGLPWSAPAFDDRKVESKPDVFCASIETANNGTNCRCYTEQMTPVSVSPKACLVMAHDGVYNPFRTPKNDRQEKSGNDQPASAKPEQQDLAKTDPVPKVTPASASSSSIVYGRMGTLPGSR